MRAERCCWRARYYDGASRRTLAADAAGRLTTVYDAKGRVSATANPDSKRISYVYDAADRRRSLLDPDGGRTSYVHDPVGRLLVLTEPRGKRTTFAYDAGGRRTLQAGANSARITSLYNAASQLAGLYTTSAGSLISRFTHTYDPASRRVVSSQATPAGLALTTYLYDPSGQLMRETRVGPSAFDTTYAQSGSRNQSRELQRAFSRWIMGYAEAPDPSEKTPWLPSQPIIPSLASTLTRLPVYSPVSTG